MPSLTWSIHLLPHASLGGMPSLTWGDSFVASRQSWRNAQSYLGRFICCLTPVLAECPVLPGAIHLLPHASLDGMLCLTWVDTFVASRRSWRNAQSDLGRYICFCNCMKPSFDRAFSFALFLFAHLHCPDSLFDCLKIVTSLMSSYSR